MDIVKNDGLMLQHISCKTYEICLAAVTENGYAIRYANEYLIDLVEIALKSKKYGVDYNMTDRERLQDVRQIIADKYSMDKMIKNFCDLCGKL